MAPMGCMDFISMGGICEIATEDPEVTVEANSPSTTSEGVNDRILGTRSVL